MPEPIAFGAAHGVYVRAARLDLEEKGVPYRLVEIDIFAKGGPPASYVDRHPFRRIPAFEHDGLQLYETGAITRYVDEAFPGPPLMPNDVRSRARVNQIINIIDNYGYGPFVRQIFKECVRAPAHGREPDETVIATALREASTCLRALSDLAYGAVDSI
jgi:glutathione S-transferase